MAAAGRLPGAPSDFADRAHGILADLGATPEHLDQAINAAVQLVEEVEASCTS